MFDPVQDLIFSEAEKRSERLGYNKAYDVALTIAYKEYFIELRNDFLKKRNYPTNDKKLNKTLRQYATMDALMLLRHEGEDVIS